MSFTVSLNPPTAARDVRDWLLEGRPSEAEATQLLREAQAAARDLRIVQAYLTGYVVELRQLDPDLADTALDLSEL